MHVRKTARIGELHLCFLLWIFMFVAGCSGQKQYFFIFIFFIGNYCFYKLQPATKRKRSKVPYDPRNGQLARTNEPGTFTDFGTAVKACGKRQHCHQRLHGTVYSAERIV